MIIPHERHLQQEQQQMTTYSCPLWIVRRATVVVRLLSGLLSASINHQRIRKNLGEIILRTSVEIRYIFLQDPYNPELHMVKFFGQGGGCLNDSVGMRGKTDSVT